MTPIKEMIEAGAKALSEYQAPMAWDYYSEEVRDAYRRKAEIVLSTCENINHEANECPSKK